MNRIYFVVFLFFLLIFFIVFLLTSIDFFNESSILNKHVQEEIDFNQNNKELINYKSRCWDPKSSKFKYYNILKENQPLENYYSLVYLVPKNSDSRNGEKFEKFLYLTSSYKNPDYPVGNWSYYNKRGKIIKKEFYKQGKIIKKIHYKYDNQYNVKEVKEYLVSNGEKFFVNSESYYFYNFDKNDAENKKLRRVDYYNQGIFLESLYYDYDEILNVIKKSVYILNHQLKSYINYSYSSNGRRIKEERYNRDNEKVFSSSYIYDFRKRLIQRNDFIKHNKSLKGYRQYTYKYKRKTFLLKEKKLDEIDKKRNQFRNIYTIYYEYNVDGCMLSESRFDSNNILVEKIVY